MSGNTAFNFVSHNVRFFVLLAMIWIIAVPFIRIKLQAHPVHLPNEEPVQLPNESPTQQPTPVHIPSIVANPFAKPAQSPPTPPPAGDKNELLVVYAYHETENALANARFFLSHALHAHADFIFIINGPSEEFEREIPKNLSNVEILQRQNKCFDLGSHGEVLGDNDRALVKQYKRFILLNSSIRGPFLPVWSKDCWSDVYDGMITEKVKLAGMTFNCFKDIPRHHINSMIYSTDQIGLNIMLDDCWQDCHKNMKTAVNCEIQTTSNIVAKGYSFNVLMTAFHGEFDSGLDYYQNCQERASYRRKGHNETDVNWNGGYFGSNYHPYETIFVKANRDIDKKLMDGLTRWHDNMKYSSWDVCGDAKKRRVALAGAGYEAVVNGSLWFEGDVPVANISQMET